jgi:hypothetical protein
MYAGQALLLIAFAGAGTEAMGHIYRTTLRQLLTREDLAMLAGQNGLTGLVLDFLTELSLVASPDPRTSP